MVNALGLQTKLKYKLANHKVTSEKQNLKLEEEISGKVYFFLIIFLWEFLFCFECKMIFYKVVFNIILYQSTVSLVVFYW